LSASRATGYAGFLSTFTTLGTGFPADCKAFRKNA
jgi:hypothetical protein